MKYNFIIDCTDEKIEEYKKIDINTVPLAGLFSRGDLSWCLQTYLLLAERKTLEVILSNRLIKNTINIIHSDHLLSIKGDPSYFIVCVRADYPKRAWAHYHLVQNKNQLGKNTSFIPHWPQPGLIKRRTNRQDVINVAYAGQVINGNLAGSISEWKNIFKPHGIQFSISEDGSWHDLQEIDVLIGVRSFDKKSHDTKPPTKLFNAWHAQIPFVGGYDSAYMQVGVPNEDYLLASTADEVIDAVCKLKTNKELYQKLVTNGLNKSQLYDRKNIISAWERLLTGPVMNRYKKWKSRPVYESLLFYIRALTGISYHGLKQLIKKSIAILGFIYKV
jgi:hypothetical protein